MRSVVVIALVLLVSACIHKPTLANIEKVAITVEKDVAKAVIVGCQDLPAIEVDINEVEQFLPPVSWGSAFQLLVNSDEVIANKVCAIVLAHHTAAAKATS